MLALGADDLIGLMPLDELIATVEAAARDHAERRTIVPERQHLHWNRNTLLTMPAASSAAVGTKLVCVAPDNAGRGLPVTSGIMVLNDPATGLPVSILNAAALTALRTGSVGALAVKYLTPHSVSSVGIVGCGVQGTWQAIFACAVRPIRTIYCLGRSQSSLERFIATVAAHVPQVQIVPCRSARELLARTDLVIAATTSSDPVLPDEPPLLAGKHFLSVGSFRPDMQELPDSVYRLCRELVVDSAAAKHEVGDVVRSLASGLVKDSEVIFIGQLVTGRRTIDTAGTTVCKSVGMALYDLYVAQALYTTARLKQVGREITL